MAIRISYFWPSLDDHFLEFSCEPKIVTLPGFSTHLISPNFRDTLNNDTFQYWVDMIFLGIQWHVLVNSIAETIKYPINWVTEGDLVQASSVPRVSSGHQYHLLLRLCSAHRVLNILIGEPIWSLQSISQYIFIPIGDMGPWMRPVSR